MLPNEKQMAALIRKIQKEANTLIAQKKKNKEELETLPVDDASTEMFNEMKKRPYTS
jgi:hypothetical protein